MGKTYYEILEVSADATQAEITAAYRERVLETHPDRSDDPNAAETFDAVTTAEEVLSDETQRARYDRLGHDAYVKMGRRFDGGSGGSDSNGGDSASDSTAGSESRRGNRRNRTSSNGERTWANDGFREGFSTNSRSDFGSRSGPSHHARQRARRKRARREQAQRTSTERTQRSETTTMGTASGTNAQTATDAADSSTDTASFRYAVHDWNDEVDLGDPGRPLDRSTIIVVCSVALIYPLLVYSSLTPQFWIPINVIVVACTLVLVGYLLTMPKVAMAVFGSWSLLVPLGLARFTAIDPFSLVGFVVVGAFWVPFGYAVAVWWVLRP